MKAVRLPGLRRELKHLADPRQRAILQSFFKTGAGEYSAGDVFIGVSVPQIRALSMRGRNLPEKALRSLLNSGIHEERMLALLILVLNFERGGPAGRRRIFDFYLKHTRRVNNWDLVDLTAYKIVGAFLHGKNKRVLNRLIRSPDMWERRIAVVATLHFIRAGECEETLRLCKQLLEDPHDLMHKAAGWMLREVGKKDRPRLEDFLERHCGRMPGTMLRYALEHFPLRRRRIFYRRNRKWRQKEVPA